MRALILAFLLIPLPALAERDADPCFDTLKPADISKRMCNYFGVLKPTKQSKAASRACDLYYRETVFALQEMCRYRKSASEFELNSRDLVGNLSGEQRKSSAVAKRVDTGAQNLSKSYHSSLLVRAGELDGKFYSYQKANRAIGEVAFERMGNEVNACGVEGGDVSLKQFGVSLYATEEAERVQAKIMGELLRLIRQTGKNAETFDALALYNGDHGDQLESLLPSPQPSPAAEFGEISTLSSPPSVAKDVASSASSDLLTKKIEGALSAKYAGAATLSAKAAMAMIGLSASADIIMRIYTHRQLDGLDFAMVGARLVIASAAAAGALPSWGTTVGAGVSAEITLTGFESWLRAKWLAAEMPIFKAFVENVAARQKKCPKMNSREHSLLWHAYNRRDELCGVNTIAAVRVRTLCPR